MIHHMALAASYTPAFRFLLWLVGLGGSITFLLTIGLVRNALHGWMRWGAVIVALSVGGSAGIRLIGQLSGNDTSSAALLIWLIGAALGLLFVVIGTLKFPALRGPR